MAPNCRLVSLDSERARRVSSSRPISEKETDTEKVSGDIWAMARGSSTPKPSSSWEGAGAGVVVGGLGGGNEGESEGEGKPHLEHTTWGRWVSGFNNAVCNIY